jgi:hypothetical protein
VPKSQNPTTSFGRTESLWQADDRRSVILTTILDALTHGPAPISNVTKFRLPTESSKPCSYSIKKWKFLVLYQNQAFKLLWFSSSLASDEFSGVERAVGRDNWQGSMTSGGGSRDPISKWRNNHYPWSISISISRWPGALVVVNHRATCSALGTR